MCVWGEGGVCVCVIYIYTHRSGETTLDFSRRNRATEPPVIYICIYVCMYLRFYIYVCIYMCVCVCV